MNTRDTERQELGGRQEARLCTTALHGWRAEPQVLSFGAIVVCRRGRATLHVNYKRWELYEGAAIVLFPNDLVLLEAEGGADFEAEMLEYSPSLLREASLQLEHTVYSAMREDRCRQDKAEVRAIVDGMFALLKVYFDQPECTCVTALVLCQLKAFFIGFHEYLQRHPHRIPDAVKSQRVRELFNRFMMLVERDYRTSRDVHHYAAQMNISPKYLTNIVRQVTGHTPKTIIDQYVILQLKVQLRRGDRSVKQLAWEYRFTDVSFFCRYFKKHTGLTPLQVASPDNA